MAHLADQINHLGLHFYIKIKILNFFLHVETTCKITSVQLKDKAFMV